LLAQPSPGAYQRFILGSDTNGLQEELAFHWAQAASSTIVTICEGFVLLHSEPSSQLPSTLGTVALSTSGRYVAYNITSQSAALTSTALAHSVHACSNSALLSLASNVSGPSRLVRATLTMLRDVDLSAVPLSTRKTAIVALGMLPQSETGWVRFTDGSSYLVPAAGAMLPVAGGGWDPKVVMAIRRTHRHTLLLQSNRSIGVRVVDETSGHMRVVGQLSCALWVDLAAADWTTAIVAGDGEWIAVLAGPTLAVFQTFVLQSQQPALVTPCAGRPTAASLAGSSLYVLSPGHLCVLPLASISQPYCARAGPTTRPIISTSSAASNASASASPTPTSTDSTLHSTTPAPVPTQQIMSTTTMLFILLNVGIGFAVLLAIVLFVRRRQQRTNLAVHAALSAENSSEMVSDDVKTMPACVPELVSFICMHHRSVC
jgi:hypothetical protein